MIAIVRDTGGTLTSSRNVRPAETSLSCTFVGSTERLSETVPFFSDSAPFVFPESSVSSATSSACAARFALSHNVWNWSDARSRSVTSVA